MELVALFADRTKESSGRRLSTAVQKVMGTWSREKQIQVLRRSKRVRAQTLLCECLSYSELSARQGNASCSGTRAQPTGLPGICCSLGIAVCFPLSGLMHSNVCPPSSYPQAGSSSCVPHAPLWQLVSIHPSLQSPLFLQCLLSRAVAAPYPCDAHWVFACGVRAGEPSLPF